jgi:hypothetical protein
LTDAERTPRPLDKQEEPTMGEIKSTIELAMERTRGLVPTGEERAELARKEAETRIRALVRRCLDHSASVQELQRQIRDLDAEQPGVSWRAVACRECAAVLAPGSHVDLVLDMIDGIGCEGSDEFRRLVLDSVRREEVARGAVAAKALESLAEAGISGTSIVPNVEADSEWPRERESLREAFERERDRIVGTWTA